ncbi:MAG: hypothetical protein MJ159_06460, partial [Treponemataceae bacterium]|nr:hypothetical protein [Treponemataceae bacterium]
MDKAIQYENAEIGKTFLFFFFLELKEDRLSIMAYYTLGHNALDISGLSKKGKRKLLGDRPGRDNMTSVSTFLIGQLGRSDRYTSKDLSGETILSECYNSISIAAKVIGGNIVFLECREHMYASFYAQQCFKNLHQ